MASALRRQVLGGYRELLRTNKLLFGRDQEGVRTGLAEIRSQFRANQHLTDAADIEAKVADIHDAVDFARTGIVQLEHAGGGHYTTKLSQEQADASMAMRDKHDGCCGGEKALEEGGVRKDGHAHGCA